MTNLEQVAADIAARINVYPNHYDAILAVLRDAERVAARRRAVGFCVLGSLLLGLVAILVTVVPQ